MRSTLKYILALPLYLALPMSASAQKEFVEGTIVYSAKVEAGDGASGKDVHTGTYTITVKGKQVKKEFQLDNNFDNTILYNGDANTVYSLRVAQGKKYAIQLDAQELMNSTSKYSNFGIRDGGSNGTIAGLPSQKANISYKDGSSIDILYTKEWKPVQENLFEHFPAINGLPLDYAYVTDNGATIHFHAEKVEPGVVESATFRLPKDYKIINNAEYQSLSKQ